MAQGYTVEWEGFSALYRAFRELEPLTHAELRRELKEAGTSVANEATGLFLEISEYTARGFKARVRASGVVVVENTRRKTTGEHPEYGGLMMRKALLPARTRKMDEFTHRAELAVGRALASAGF